MIRSKIALLSTAFILAACAGFQADQKEEAAPPPVAHKADIPAPHPAQPKPSTIQPNFACTNNVKLNVTFSKNRRFAYIVFPDSGIKEILKDTHIASGMEYGNGEVFFIEHQGHSELVHPIHGKARTETCHRIRRKTKASHKR
ncbi:MAG: hypothetical protein PHW76_06360 [Alphaproteobacteria bacterium]|nr:hypothetical protein [Alphaproteobacteria bacterium]